MHFTVNKHRTEIVEIEGIPAIVLLMNRSGDRALDKLNSTNERAESKKSRALSLLSDYFSAQVYGTLVGNQNEPQAYTRRS